MNSNLAIALYELRSSGAVGVPSREEVEAAKDGTEWIGRKAAGDQWLLQKTSVKSYLCVC